MEAATNEDLDALIARLNAERAERWKDLNENLRAAEMAQREAYIELASRPPPPPTPRERYSDPVMQELEIPHNWGIGLGEGFDYLDAETRHLIYQAMELEEDRLAEF